MSPLKSQKLPYRWDLLSRYRLIEIIALWEGRITTKTLIQAFGIGRQQASKDINRYINDIAPTNLTYDGQLKGYKPTENFQPKLTKGDVGEYLQLLNSQQDIMAEYLSLADQTNTEILAPPVRSIDANIVRPIIQAARENKRVDIRYLSMSSTYAKERIISPHSIVFNGYRWHIRAFCEEQQNFRDFVLSRIVEVFDLEGNANQQQRDDLAWNTKVKIIVAPDPRLTKFQQSIIARDYGMTDNQQIYCCRGSLVTYFLQLLNLDYAEPDPNPNIQQIIVENIIELEPWRF